MNCSESAIRKANRLLSKIFYCNKIRGNRKPANRVGHLIKLKIMKSLKSVFAVLAFVLAFGTAFISSATSSGKIVATYQAATCNIAMTDQDNCTPVLNPFWARCTVNNGSNPAFDATLGGGCQTILWTPTP